MEVSFTFLQISPHLWHARCLSERPVGNTAQQTLLLHRLGKVLGEVVAELLPGTIYCGLALPRELCGHLILSTPSAFPRRTTPLFNFPGEGDLTTRGITSPAPHNR